jgi:hypothetical protein
MLCNSLRICAIGSPRIQQDLDLDRDATWYTKKGEGDKLRDDD